MRFCLLLAVGVIVLKLAVLALSVILGILIWPAIICVIAYLIWYFNSNNS